jgi:hypothetical protein
MRTSLRVTDNEVERNCYIIPMVKPPVWVQTPSWAQPVTNAHCNARVADGYRILTANDHKQA